MAKVSFNKLGATKENGVTEIVHNEQKIEVKKYLPINEKLDLISNIINGAYDSKNSFANPLKINVLLAINMIEKYTNINFTDKQKEDPAALYDKLMGSDLYREIYMAIPAEEIRILTNGLWDTVDAFYKYKNSIMGIIETVTQDYSDLELDAAKIQEKLADPNVMPLLKTVAEKLG